MWYLTSENDSRILYIVLQNKDITIGRSVDSENCNFALHDDPSISRKHAILSISENCLYLQDLGSRYGTFVNDFINKIEGNANIKLKSNDNIKFGKLKNVWKVHETPIVTCTSTLKGENLHNLKLSINKLGGTLKSDWDDTCVYLTMPAITLTVKVVLALVQGSHIVTIDFWNKCIEAVNNYGKLPNPSNFIPQVIESTLNKENVSFAPNNKRKVLFDGKKVIFFSRKQLEMYKGVLIKSSANALLLSESKMTKSMLCQQGVIVIQYNVVSSSQETQAQRNQINDILNYLKNKGKRVIADAEIGLAILYCSIDKYCNPDFNFTNEILKQSFDQNTKTTNILAHESQEPTNSKLFKEKLVINESLTSKQDISNINETTSVDKVTNHKRKLSEDNDNIQSNVNKKMATDNDSKIQWNSERIKRKFSDDNNEIQINPTKKVAINNFESTETDDIFNFKNMETNKDTQKKLNFSKPLKRKHDVITKDEDDLFNFIEDKTKKASETSKNKIFDTNNISKNVSDSLNIQADKYNVNNNNVDISTLRGLKLKELMENNLKLCSTNNIPQIKNIKKEVTDDLGEKLSDLNLGSTMIKTRKDLIVKREPIQIEMHNNQTKNFKKFKKVWPMNRQATMISKSSMSIFQSGATEVIQVQ